MKIEKEFAGLRFNFTGARIAMMALSIMVLAIVVGVYMYKSRSGNAARSGIDQSAAPADVSGDSGAGGPTADYAKRLNQKNKDDAQIAIKSGDTFISVPSGNDKPAPIAPLYQQQSVSSGDLLKADGKPGDTKNTTGKLDSDKLVPDSSEAVRPAVQPSQQDVQPSRADQAKLDGVTAELDKVTSMLDEDESAQTVLVKMPEPQKEVLAATVTQTATADHASKEAVNPIRPGTVLYGVFDLPISSDLPGPVLGEIVQGKYSGAKVLGSFQQSNNGGDTMVIKVNTIVPKTGPVIPVDAYVVDPSTKVDYHITMRTASLLGSVFMGGVQGYGQAISQGGSTVVSGLAGSTVAMPVATNAMAEAAAASSAMQALQPVQQVLTNNITKPDTIHVAAGTPFGLLIVK